MSARTRLDEFVVNVKDKVPNLIINKTFYFDESNNIKKGIIGNEKDNNYDLENIYFVLGGIAIDKPVDFNALLKYVGARQTPTDAKFSFFSFKKTKFEEAIRQSRLRKFFEYLINNEILIHFDLLHYFHFALTSACSGEGLILVASIIFAIACISIMAIFALYLIHDAPTEEKKDDSNEK